MRRETGKTWVGVVLGVVLVAPLAACSGATTPPVATSSGATTSASPSEATIAALPPSVLTPLAGVTYTETAASRAAMASTRVADTVSAFSGAISRELVVGGKAVAGVQVYRFTPKIAAADLADRWTHGRSRVPGHEGGGDGVRLEPGRRRRHPLGS